MEVTSHVHDVHDFQLDLILTRNFCQLCQAIFEKGIVKQIKLLLDTNAS